jgi:hypothetical protein
MGKERRSRTRLIVENALLLTAATVGLVGSRDVQPTSWYLWGSSEFDARGCASVWVMQSHQVMPQEHVTLDIQPVGGEPANVDLSGKSTTVFSRTVCSPNRSGIVFTTRRDETQADPSVFTPTP